MLQRELKPAIRSKKEGNCQKKFCCCTTTSAPTLETLKQLMWEAMEHPAYNPDLAPSDFHLFRPLKEALRGR